MHIEGKQMILNPNRHIGNLKGKDLYFGIKLKQSDYNTIQRIGFEKIELGKSIYPSVDASHYCYYNLFGKEVINKTLREQIEREIPYKVHDWHGQLHTGTYFRTYDRYKRDIIWNYGFRVSIVEINEEKYLIIDKKISNTDSNIDEVKFAMNFFISTFGHIYVIDDTMNLIDTTSYKKVNWKILPIGEAPFESIHMKIKLRYKSKHRQEPIWKRQTFLKSFNPSTILSGEGGFSDYLVYLYPKYNIAILESIIYGNAIYIFEYTNWERLSQSTKKEILQGHHEKERVVHYESYYNNIEKYFILGKQ